LNAFNELTNNSDRNPWCIGIARFDIDRLCLISPSPRPLISAANLSSHHVAFVADPFRVVTRGETFVFAEAWSRSNQRGQIAAFRLNAAGHVAESAIVLAEPFHLSYPCVFKAGDSYYMMPEAWETGQLVLYRAREFPWSWEPFKVLLEIAYADPQIFLHESTWYIFLNTDPLTNAEGSVFWTESLFGQWQPHPQNPIFRNDPRLARSAGPIIRHGRRIIRFSQDCEQQYGRCVFASELVELSPSAIRTESIGPVDFERPAWARNAFHHLDLFRENGVCYALFDGYTSGFDPTPQ
jgi:hypothetical protein